MKQFLLLSLLFFISCAKSSGPGTTSSPKKNPTPTTIQTTNSPLEFSDLDGYFFGIMNVSTQKSKTILVQNTGLVKSQKITITGIELPFILTNNNCDNLELNPNQTCSFDIEFSSNSSGKFSNTLTISEGSFTYSFNIGAYTTSLNNISAELDDIAINILTNQNANGTFPTEQSIEFDFNTTLFIANSLSLAKEKNLLSQEIYSGTYGLNNTLNYLETINDGSGNRPIDFLNDRDVINPAWTRGSNPAMKVREIFPAFPIIHNNITKNKDNSIANSYAYKNDFLNNRKLSTNDRSMFAQFSYIFDNNRLSALYPNNSEQQLFRNQQKDLYLLFQSLEKENLTSELNQLADISYRGLIVNSGEMLLDYGINTSYSKVEFVSGISSSNYVNSNMTHDFFSYPITAYTANNYENHCEQMSYNLLILQYIIKYSSFKEDKESLINDTSTYFVNQLKSNFLDKTTSSDPNFKYYKRYCRPLALLALYKTSRKIVPSTILNQYIEDFEKSLISTSNYSFIPDSNLNAAPPSYLSLSELLNSATILINN